MLHQKTLKQILKLVSVYTAIGQKLVFFYFRQSPHRQLFAAGQARLRSAAARLKHIVHWLWYTRCCTKHRTM